MADDPLKNIPGTVVFTGEQCRKGYLLNQFCMTLNKAENRAQFKIDEAKYLDKFSLSDTEKSALKARDYNRLLDLGGTSTALGKSPPSMENCSRNWARECPVSPSRTFAR